MTRYALTSGLVVPADAVEKLEYIAARIRREGQDSDSLDLKTDGSTAGDDTYSNADGNGFVRLLATIHDQLVRIVAPATPRGPSICWRRSPPRVVSGISWVRCRSCAG